MRCCRTDHDIYNNISVCKLICSFSLWNLNEEFSLSIMKYDIILKFFPNILLPSSTHVVRYFSSQLGNYNCFLVLICRSILKHIQTDGRWTEKYLPRTPVYIVKYVCLDLRNGSTKWDHRRIQRPPYTEDRRSISSALRLEPQKRLLIVTNRLHSCTLSQRPLQCLCTVQMTDS